MVTQSQAVAASPVATAYSAVKVGAGARHRTRTWARVEGYVLPAVHGTARSSATGAGPAGGR